MLELIKEENVEVGVHAADWEDAIRRSAQHLLETGKIEERYIRAMIDAVPLTIDTLRTFFFVIEKFIFRQII